MRPYRRVNPDVEAIFNQIAHIEHGRRLTRETSRELARLRFQAEACSALIYILPMECLCYIFLLAAQMDHEIPWTVAQVCRSWRKVALHYSPLWSLIRIGSKEGPECRKLGLWMQRAGQSLLDVEMVVPDRQGGASELIRRRINQCCKILIWNVSHTRLDLITGSSTTLRCLDLAGFQVTGTDPILALLEGCPNLHALVLRYIQVTRPASANSGGVVESRVVPPSTHQGVSLLHLRDLVLPEWSPLLINNLIPRIYTPQLRNVDLSAHGCDPQHQVPIAIRPARGSWDNVVRITLRGCAFTDAVALQCLALVPKAEMIGLRSVWITDAFLQAVCQPSPSYGRLAPRLAWIHLHTVNDVTPGALGALIQARAEPKTALARRPPPGASFLRLVSVEECGNITKQNLGWVTERVQKCELRVSTTAARDGAIIFV